MTVGELEGWAAGKVGEGMSAQERSQSYGVRTGGIAEIVFDMIHYGNCMHVQCASIKIHSTVTRSMAVTNTCWGEDIPVLPSLSNSLHTQTPSTDKTWAGPTHACAHDRQPTYICIHWHVSAWRSHANAPTHVSLIKRTWWKGMSNIKFKEGEGQNNIEKLHRRDREVKATKGPRQTSTPSLLISNEIYFSNILQNYTKKILVISAHKYCNTFPLCDNSLASVHIEQFTRSAGD